MKWEYEYWFAGVRPLSDKKKCRLRKEYGQAEQIYYIEETRLNRLDYLNDTDVDAIVQSRKKWDLSGKYEELLKKNIRFRPYFHLEYPAKLKKLAAPPYALYIKGRLPSEQLPAAAIVGARRCSMYGGQAAVEFGEKLAAAGVQIISGMARGIDGAGHRGALNAGGNTYGVSGCGVDICYPREHLGLYMDLQKEGGILSEYPPGTAPLPAYFPQRNRIISGLADVVLVMEAKEKSGSLITADLALEQGKDVYALPGPVNSTLSYGCNNLIRQGAGILLSPEDLLFEIGIMNGNFNQNSDKNEKTLESPENIVYSCLGLSPKSISQLTDELNLSSRQILEQLITLELQGYIKEISKNYYVRIKK